FKYIQPAVSPAGELRGGYVAEEVVEVDELSGNVIVVGTYVQIIWPAGKTIGFSCSSKRTISVMPRLAFNDGGVVHVTGPVRPSRQILKFVLKLVAPPWI